MAPLQNQIESLTPNIQMVNTGPLNKLFCSELCGTVVCLCMSLCHKCLCAKLVLHEGNKGILLVVTAFSLWNCFSHLVFLHKPCSLHFKTSSVVSKRHVSYDLFSASSVCHLTPFSFTLLLYSYCYILFFFFLKFLHLFLKSFN